MMWRKIAAAFLVIILLISTVSCDNVHNNHGSGQNINTPPDTTEENNNEVEDEQPITYVYSVMSKSIHYADCHSVKIMNEDYKREFQGDISELLNKGYTLCQFCFPPRKDETEKEEEEVEEDPNKIAKEDATYVINKKNLKLHELDCQHVKSMNDSNVLYTDLTLEELIALDLYAPCGTCMPDEYEEYKELHPEKFEE